MWLIKQFTLTVFVFWINPLISLAVDQPPASHGQFYNQSEENFDREWKPRSIMPLSRKFKAPEAATSPGACGDSIGACYVQFTDHESAVPALFEQKHPYAVPFSSFSSPEEEFQDLSVTCP